MMDEVTTKQGGRTAESIVEGGAGGEYCRALILYNLGSAVEMVEAEFAYDAGQPAEDLLRLVRDLGEHLAKISVREDASLTLFRHCARCSGEGEPSCIECGGTGSVHADEADG